MSTQHCLFMSFSCAERQRLRDCDEFVSFLNITLARVHVTVVTMTVCYIYTCTLMSCTHRVSFVSRDYPEPTGCQAESDPRVQR